MNINNAALLRRMTVTISLEILLFLAICADFFDV